MGSNNDDTIAEIRDFGDEKMNSIYRTMSPQNKSQLGKLSREEQIEILKRVENKRGSEGTDDDNTKTSILEVEEEKTKTSGDGDDDDNDDTTSSSSIPPPPPSGALKKVNFDM